MQTCLEGREDLVTLLWPLCWQAKVWGIIHIHIMKPGYFTKYWLELYSQQEAISWFSIFLAIYEMNKVQIQVTEWKKKNNPSPSGVSRLLNRMVLCPVYVDRAAREKNVPIDMMPCEDTDVLTWIWALCNLCNLYMLKNKQLIIDMHSFYMSIEKK